VAGRTYARSSAYDVTREKIREFAAAVGDEHPAYIDPAAARALGYADVIAPATFASVLTLGSWSEVMADLSVDFADVLHVDQRFVVSRPLRVGDTVRAQTVVDDVRHRMGASWLTLRTEVATESDEHVCTSVATIMVRLPADDEPHR